MWLMCCMMWLRKMTIAMRDFLGADGVLPVEPMHAMPVATMERLRKQQAAVKEGSAG